MKVRFQPRTAREVEIRDMRGHRLGTWRAGQEEEIDPNERAAFREATGTTVIRPVLESIFSCGPDFVDAKTGKNPWYVCDECGEDALDEHFTDRATLEPIYIRRDPKNATSARLCLTDFLAEHPEYEQHHIRAGAPTAMITEARSRRKDPVDPPLAIGASYGGVTAPEPSPEAKPEPEERASFAQPTADAAGTDEGHE